MTKDKIKIFYRYSRLLVCERCGTSHSPTPPIDSNLLLYGGEKMDLFIKKIKRHPTKLNEGLTPHLIGRVRYLGKDFVEALTVCGVEGCGWEKVGEGNLIVTRTGILAREAIFEILEQKVSRFCREDFEDIINSSIKKQEYMFL